MSEEKLRLFVAVELAEPERDALVDWRSQATQGLDGLRLIGPEDLHVTVCFLGWQRVEEVGAIRAACGGASASLAAPRLDLRTGAAIWLPPRRPRVLAVELIDPAGQLAWLQAALSARLESGGWYRPEVRPYRAHVTVARVRRGVRVPARDLPAAPPMRFAPRHVTLFRSRPSPSGARYEALARMPIG